MLSLQRITLIDLIDMNSWPPIETHAKRSPMKTFLLVFFFAVFVCTQALAENETVESIQRYRFVGSADGGKRVAILLSHFGPSSHAPFVNLITKEVSKPFAETVDSKFFMQGGEAELKQLEKLVLDANEKTLEQRGFKVPTAVLETPSYWQGNAPATGYLDPQNDSGLRKLTVDTTSVKCSANSTGLDWRVCTTPGACSDSTSNLACQTVSVQVQKVVRVDDTFWVIAARKLKAIEPLRFIAVDFNGIQF